MTCSFIALFFLGSPSVPLRSIYDFIVKKKTFLSFREGWGGEKRNEELLLSKERKVDISKPVGRKANSPKMADQVECWRLTHTCGLVIHSHIFLQFFETQ